MLISGQGFWFKALGAPQTNRFDETKKQWTFDLAIDKATQTKLLEAGIRKSYIKNKNDDRGAFISFSRDAVRKGGEPGKPIQVVDHRGEPWDPKKLVGNGSTLNVKIALNEREYNGQKFLKPSVISVQIWNLVEYVRPDHSEREEFPIDEDRVPTEALETDDGKW